MVTPPLTNYAPLIVARDNGWFDEENLAVSWSTVTQTAVSIEAVYGGSAEFGGGGILEPMIARGNGLDVMLAVPTARIRSTAPDNSGIAVRANSEIGSAADLAGKRVSVGLINSINHVHMIEWLRKTDVDAKTVQFIEIPFPQIADALLRSQLDAVWAVEPFITVMKNRRCSGPRLSVSGQRAEHGSHRVLRQGDLAQGECRHRTPLPTRLSARRDSPQRRLER